MERKRNYNLLFCLLLVILFLVGCAEKKLLYEGSTDNWKIVYKINQNQDEIGIQDIDIRYLGEDIQKELTFSSKSINDAGCELNLILDENGEANHSSSSCLSETRPGVKDDSFKVSITWGEKEETIELKKIN
ncbi:hypothetical protein I2483_18870 [Sporosarcina sp. E16_3]|uniref:hypothetical protein n=1 Tax=Sporosarcina sp. E16_3 TaxID=2789293 RepID=UPI001A9136CA|nr:hypothetical protein [Sporosarcina sp. E16_3]MBO0603730.1 hypothetical protein [Sporosarcina sp. E16_3]